MTVKAAGLNPHSGSHWKRLSCRRHRRLVSLNYHVTHLFGLLNISITFSNAHLVLLCYIFRFSNGFKHVKMSRMPQQGQFFLLRVWGLAQHRTITFSSELPTFTILTVKLVIRTCLGLHTSVVNPATID